MIIACNYKFALEFSIGGSYEHLSYAGFDPVKNVGYEYF